jgi:hypothetical protein
MRRLRLSLVLTAGAAALLLFPLGSFGGTDANTWSGTWNTNFGTMTLTQSGSSVGGSYGHDQGKITGTIAGNVLSGTWSEAPTYAGPNDAGPFKWTLAAGGKSWSGTWQYAGSSSGGDWSGTCTGGACLNNGQATSCARPPRLSASATAPKKGCKYSVHFSFTQKYEPFRFGKDLSLPDRVTSAGVGAVLVRDWDPRHDPSICGDTQLFKIAHNHDRLVPGKPRPEIDSDVIRLAPDREQSTEGCVKLEGTPQKLKSITLTLPVVVDVSNDPKCREGSVGTVRLRAGGRRPSFDYVIIDVCRHRHVYTPQTTLAKEPQRRVEAKITIALN